MRTVWAVESKPVPVENVRLDRDLRGNVWAVAECCVCRAVHTYLAKDSLSGVRCGTCHHKLDMIAAVDAARQRYSGQQR